MVLVLSRGDICLHWEAMKQEIDGVDDGMLKVMQKVEVVFRCRGV